jgi:uncharacterized protein (DUF3084 family)
MTDIAADNGNGKVTLALLSQDMRNANAKLDQLLEELKAQRARMEELDRWRARAEVQLANTQHEVQCQKEDLEQVKKTSNWWNGANSLGALIAAILGITQR